MEAGSGIEPLYEDLQSRSGIFSANLFWSIPLELQSISTIPLEGGIL